MYKKLFKRPLYTNNFALLHTDVLSVKTGLNITPYLIKIMKLSLIQFLLLAVTFQISLSAPVRAQLLDRRVTVDINNQKLEAALKAIAAKANIRLVYNNQIWKNSGSVNVNFNNAKIKDVFDKVLQATDLTYEVINDQFIVLKPCPAKATQPTKAPIAVEAPITTETKAGFVVTGIVTDENNEPLPGVSIKVKNGFQAVATNAKGMYSIGVSHANSTLAFSFIGYQTFETLVNGTANVNVKMIPDPARLDEVHIIGYGTTTKRTSTGSQVGISAKEIENQPVTNVLQALEGRMAGVFVTQSNGMPGAGITVQIRGANSLAKSNLPLYIIDGVPYLSTPINTATGSGLTLPSAEGNTSPMNSINPDDIENIEVLKDADATAIYGSRAANGVVLITTKKGKEGKTKFSFNASTGTSKVSHFVNLLGTDQFLALRAKGYSNFGVTPTAIQAPDLLTWDQHGYTDFQRLLFGNTAHSNNVSGNVSGGDARTNFYLSGTYHDEKNVYPGGQGYKRGGLNFNLSHSSYDNRFNLTFSAIYSADKNNISTTNLAAYAYSLAPNFPLYNPDGSLYWFSTTNNPLGYLNQTNDNGTTNLLGNIALKYNIVKGLDFKTSVGYSKTDMTQTTIRPLSSMNPANNPTSGTASYTYNYTNNYIVEPQLTYKTTVWKGTLDLLTGGTWQYKQSVQPYYVSASGFPSDDFLTNISSATTKSVSSASQDYKYVSVFGRATYNVLNKYIVNGTFRRDGSSRFGPGNKFGNFGSVGAAWVFSEENLIKNNLNWLSFGKIRGSYGVVGNDDIGNYQYYDSYSASTYVYNGSTGLVPSRIPNSDFKWESTNKLEFGLELGFLKDRLSLSGSYYRNRTTNQLLNYQISAQTGFTTYQSNLPATVQNAGVELSLTSTNIKGKNFSWMSSFNISKNKNKLLSFTNIEKSSYYTTYVVGNPISAYNLYQYAGISATTGLPTFTDFDNSGTVNSGFAATGRGDRYYVGTSYPDFYGGLTNTVNYKGLSLDFTFQFVKQKGRSLLSSSFYPPGYGGYNAAASVMNDYLALGSADKLVTAVTSVPAASAAYSAYTNYAASDASVIDASFIRMKNVNLSYSLPVKWVSKIGAQAIRVYVQGQNLFTITNYTGFDPESQGVTTPPLRTITTGLQCTF